MKELAKQVLRPVTPYIPDAIHQWWSDRHLKIDSDPALFAEFSEPLRPIMAKVASTRFYSYADERRITGWLSRRERQTLYALGRWIPGPITEIGTWVGLSTTAIARGIKDSGVSKIFNTYDLPLSMDSFRPVEGGLGMFLPGEADPRGVCTDESFRNNILPVISAPGGSNGLLKRNLSRLGLLDLVEPHFGDFQSFNPIESSFLFCDALHDEKEIATNATGLRPWLRKGSVLACHDVGGSPKLIEALREILPLGAGATIDSMYVAEVIA